MLHKLPWESYALTQKNVDYDLILTLNMMNFNLFHQKTGKYLIMNMNSKQFMLKSNEHYFYKFVIKRSNKAQCTTKWNKAYGDSDCMKFCQAIQHRQIFDLAF